MKRSKRVIKPVTRADLASVHGGFFAEIVKAATDAYCDSVTAGGAFKPSFDAEICGDYQPTRNPYE